MHILLFFYTLYFRLIKRKLYIEKLIILQVVQTCLDTHFCDTFSTSLIQPSLTSLWAQFIYYILFYSFKHGPSPCDLWEKLRKCSLEEMGRFLSNSLHEPRPSVLPRGQGTLVAPQTHGGGLVPKISTSKELPCSR